MAITLKQKQILLIENDIWTKTMEVTLKKEKTIKQALMTNKCWEAQILKDDGWKTLNTSKDFSNFACINPSGHKMISEVFWCCNCEKNYIRTVIHSKCPICGAQFKSRIPHIKQIKDVLNYQNLVFFEDYLLKIERKKEMEEIENG